MYLALWTFSCSIPLQSQANFYGHLYSCETHRLYAFAISLGRKANMPAYFVKISIAYIAQYMVRIRLWALILTLNLALPAMPTNNRFTNS
jgi:hypothetical protein